MPLHLDPQGLRSIEQVIADLTETADKLSPTDPRAAKIAEMIRELRIIEAERPARGSGSDAANPMS